MKNTFRGLLLGLILVLGVFIVTACEKKEEKPAIVGTWQYQSSSSYTYVFNEDGTGSYAGSNFTYTIDGNKLSILYTGNTSPFVSEFSIDGNVLNIKDSFGNDTLYNRK
jgi:hypothetical protein